MNTEADSVELKLPFKAEYVSIARLAVSGIANRIGFDIDAIEDIKVAVAEVCNKLVSMGSKNALGYIIQFKILDSRIDIFFDSEDKSLKCIFDDKNDELGISIITALMDEVEFCSDDTFILSMSKSIEGNY